MLPLLESEGEGGEATVLVLRTLAPEERGHSSHRPAAMSLVVSPAARVLGKVEMNEGGSQAFLPLVLFSLSLARELDEAASAAAGVVAIMKVERQAVN